LWIAGIAASVHHLNCLPVHPAGKLAGVGCACAREMPNGYSWLKTANWSIHRYNRWVIQTGRETKEGAEHDTFRDPDDVESRLIDVAISQDMSSSLVWHIPTSCYKSMKFTGGVPQDEGTIRWIGHTDATEKVVASTWFVEGEILTWKDAFLMSAGVEETDSLMMVLKTSCLTNLHQKKRTLYLICAVMAVRVEEDTVCTVPMFRAWDGNIEIAHEEPEDEKLVAEVIQRSLVAHHSYEPAVPLAQAFRDNRIKVQLLGQEEFLNLMD